jgi:hypothetical protein
MKEEEEEFADYYERQVEEGYIEEDGTPTKCKCGCTEFKKVEVYHMEGWVVEYAFECTNEDCLAIVGRWSYGHWEV